MTPIAIVADLRKEEEAIGTSLLTQSVRGARSVMVFGLRSTTAKDGALLVGSVVASTAVSMVAAPVIALIKSRVETLVKYLGVAQSGKGKFIFEFFWGGINGALMQAIMSPFRVLQDGYRYASLAALLIEGSASPGSISEYAA